jgi:hypothetical protein
MKINSVIFIIVSTLSSSFVIQGFSILLSSKVLWLLSVILAVYGLLVCLYIFLRFFINELKDYKDKNHYI